LADAFIVGANFIGDDSVTMILGDNIFEEDFSSAIKNFKSGAQIYIKKHDEPQRLGVVVILKVM
jgi:glucose-1-phosphate thymidylyltransferase